MCLIIVCTSNFLRSLSILILILTCISAHNQSGQISLYIQTFYFGKSGPKGLTVALKQGIIETLYAFKSGDNRSYILSFMRLIPWHWSSKPLILKQNNIFLRDGWILGESYLQIKQNMLHWLTVNHELCHLIWTQMQFFWDIKDPVLLTETTV